MLSVVLATHNEEKNIERCLSAVRNWVDEIIIVDGESTDRTVELARTFGAQIIPTTNKANFHINKQLAISAASGDLILQLDADEVVDDELANFIKLTHRQVLSRKPEDNETLPVAWNIKRKNLFLGHFLTKGGQYPDPVIRLFVRGYAELPQLDVHEQMIVNGVLAWADGHLIHYANPTFSDYLRKWQAYTSFKATQLADDGVKINFINGCKYLVWLPIKTFGMMYGRHKGFMDGVAGLVFSIMSGMYFVVAYLKLWENHQNKVGENARSN